MNTMINRYKPISCLWEVIVMLEHAPEILTFKECKDLLKIGKNSLLALIHDGQIEAFRIGNRWKIPKSAVVTFIRYQM